MSQSKIIIIFGFSTIIILAFISNFICVLTLSKSNNQLDEFVTVNYHKIHLVHYLRFTSRERTLSLLRMLSTTDDDELIEIMDNIARNGGLYAKYREEYLLLSNSDDEQELLNRHDEISNRGGLLHIKIADHILFDERDIALAMISGPLVDMHKDESSIYTQLIDYHMNQGQLAIQNNKNNYNHLISNLWVLLALVILIGIGIMIFMLRLISRNEYHQIKSKKDLEAALITAKYASNAKSELLSNMSHELRTPLHAIMGFADIISHRKDIDPKLEKYISRIKDASNHLLTLVDEVLDLSNIENGKLNFQIKPIKLKSVLSECYSLIEPVVEKAQLNLNFDTDVPYTVQADPTRLKQAVLNLLSNAVKYNTEFGFITVTCTVINNKSVRINITDTGLGISEEQKNIIFEPFERLKIDSKDIQGTGIGLSITKNLIEQMGGKAGVDSIQGEGSTLWLELTLISS